MSSTARSGMARQPDWYLHDGAAEIGPLSEMELRKRLAEAGKAQLGSWRVRQGASDWHPATRVLARFKELALNGVFLRLDEVAHGPFTPERAAELLRTEGEFASRQGEVLVKVGRHEPWQPASGFLTALDQLLQRNRQAANNQSGSGQFDAEKGEPMSPLAKAVLIEEPTAAAEPRPVAFFKASLVPEDETASRSPRPAAVVRKSAGSAAATPVAVYPQPVRRPVAAKRSRGLSPAMKLGIGIGVPALLLVAVVAFVFMLVSGDEQEIAENGSSANNGGSLEAGQTDKGTVNARPPVVSVGMLFRPKFVTTDGPIEAGSAFAARLAGSQRPIIISALHLFGPAGGMDRDVPAEQLSNVWQSLELSDCVTQRDLGPRAGRVLTLPGSRPLPDESPVGDVVAYMPDSISGLSTFPLATSKPSAGDRVWLVSEVVTGPSLVHGATVEGVDAGFLVYRFDNRSLEIIATSGAPVLNAKHEVVAVNAGGGEIDGAMIGVGTPTYKFYEPLARAAGLR